MQEVEVTMSVGTKQLLLDSSCTLFTTAYAVIHSWESLAVWQKIVELSYI